MTDRIALELFLSDTPTGRVLVLPLSEGQWRALCDDGHRSLGPEDHKRLCGLAELSRFKAQSGSSL